MGILLALIFVFTAFPARAQSSRFEGFEDDILESPFIRNPDRQALRNFRLPESWEAERLITRARERIEARDYGKAVELLDRVIEEQSEHVFQVAVDALPNSRGCARFVGAAEFALYLLSSLPAEGLDAYEAYAENKAGGRLADALSAGALDVLEELAARFAPSNVGRRALHHLIESLLERGEHEAAVIRCETALLFEREVAAEVRIRLIQALDRLGREDAKSRWIKDSVTKGIVLPEAFLADLQSNPSVMDSSEPCWKTLGGDGSRARAMRLHAMDGDLMLQWNRDFLDPALVELNPFHRLSDQADVENQVPFHLLRSGELLVINDSISLRAFNIYTGEEVWRYLGPLAENDASNDFYTLEDYINTFRRTSITTLSPYLIAGGTVDGDMVFANVQGHRLRRESRTLDRRVINKAIPERGLVAIGLADGALRWARGERDQRDGDFMSRASFPSPPLVVGDRVYLNAFVTEGGINSFILCLDRGTGRLIWKVSVGIGQQELTMFNMEYKEFAACPLTEASGSLIYCSNLGFVCALDAITGRIRWMTEYEAIPLPQANQFERRPEPRPVFFSNNPPVVIEDRVIVTPIDGQHISAFDLNTGKSLWRRKARLLGTSFYPHLVGVHEHRVIFSGIEGALAVSARDGLRLWRAGIPSDGSAIGRGAVTRDRLYLPVNGGLIAYDLATGKALAEYRTGFRDPPVNLFLMDEVVVLAGLDSLGVYYNAEALLAQAEKRIQEGEGTVEDFTFLGDMYRVADRFERAVAWYDQALDILDRNPGFSPVRRAKLVASLHGAHLALGRHEASRGRVAQAKAAFAAALSGAEMRGELAEPHNFVEAAMALVDLMIKTGDPSFEGETTSEDVGITLDTVMDRLYADCPRFRWDYSDDDDLAGEAPVGLYVLLTRYRQALARNDSVAQIRHLQAMLEAFPAEHLMGDTLRVTVTRLVRDLIAREGRAVYAEFDRRAAEALAEARKRGGLAEMESIAERFPNAEVAGTVALETAKTYLDRSATDRVFQVLIRFLASGEAFDSGKESSGTTDEGDSRVWPHALYLLARAAESEGNDTLRLALERRLLARFGNRESLWAKGRIYEDLLRGPGASAGSATLAPSLPRGEISVHTKTLNAKRCHFVPFLGTPPASMKRRVLVEMEDVSQLILLDVETAESVWVSDISQFQAAPGREAIFKASATESVLTCIFETRIAAFDMATGEALWDYDPRGIVMEADQVHGLLCTVSIPVQDDEAGDLMTLRVLEPTTGLLLWMRELALSPSSRLIPLTEGICVCSPSSRRGTAMWLFDPLTGRQRAHFLEPDGLLSPLPFRSPPGRLLALLDRPKPDGRRGERIKELRAYDPLSGKACWTLPFTNWSLIVKGAVLTPWGAAFHAWDMEGRRSSKVVLFIDLDQGRILERIPLENAMQVIPFTSRFPVKKLYFRSGRELRTLNLHALDLATRTFTVEGQPFPIGDARTQNSLIRDGALCRDGLAIPLDFTFRLGGKDLLCSQVLLVDERTGRLIHALDIFWKRSELHPPLYSQIFPLEVKALDGYVLALKRAELYIIAGGDGSDRIHRSGDDHD